MSIEGRAPRLAVLIGAENECAYAIWPDRIYGSVATFAGKPAKRAFGFRANVRSWRRNELVVAYRRFRRSAMERSMAIVSTSLRPSPAT